ncbi:MAG: alpha-glucuronidase [Chitinophagaceae bacterium]|nr:alpha-glucuronidase [Chitinophagaceae bacterium]MCW5928320.1 alpha-glucuronidase [Chitinophagaceae bacterium]
MKKNIVTVIVLLLCISVLAEDGYRLWLRYDKISDPAVLKSYRNHIGSIVLPGSSATLSIARNELQDNLRTLLDRNIPVVEKIKGKSIVAGTPASSLFVRQFLEERNLALGEEGYAIYTTTAGGKNIIVIAAQNDIGVLYGVYSFLKLLQTQQPVQALNIKTVPSVQRRMLNHWDNLNRTVERGYAGASIWNWHTLPDYIDKRYIDYARANASIGINGTVLTNVNANAQSLTKEYLIKAKALADVFRPYGIRVYLTARFSAPVEIGGLTTADPLEPEVQNWWKEKCKEIYSYIPDFGGFLVKANSEGQPGPQTYGRSHVEGANMFAEALEPYAGIVIWRAFVYDVRVQKKDEHFEEGKKEAAGESIAAADRFKQAYAEFKPFDGQFRSNVLIQVKNGPIDFQPREPFSPLFGATPQTPLTMEFQMTLEYLGQATHLVYEAPLFKEVLDADTWAKGEGSTVARVIDGSLFQHKISGTAGVANIGNERNWTGHPFGQANWYAFGRLAWNDQLTSEEIAEEWIRQTFSNQPDFVDAVKKIMMASREAVVNYMTPLGLHHIMGTGHHYGPAPWVDNGGRADWNPVYYHRADEKGIGFDRTAAGSNAIAQYYPQVQARWKDVNTCEEDYLLWFHHVSWLHPMKSGRTLWDELCFRYQQGVDTVRWMQDTWNALQPYLDRQQFEQVKMLLDIQEKEAMWWRNACLLYFQTFSKRPIPDGVEKPDHDLEYYKNLRFPYAPGIGGRL